MAYGTIIPVRGVHPRPRLSHDRSHHHDIRIWNSYISRKYKTNKRIIFNLFNNQVITASPSFFFSAFFRLNNYFHLRLRLPSHTFNANANDG